jgi:hypothetical protein
MSRDLTTVLGNALDDSVIEPFFAVDLLFDNPNELYFWTGLGERTINGKTYLGTGEIMAISSVEETSQISAKGATVTFSGIPNSFLTTALSEPYQGRICNFYFGVMSNPDQYSEIFSGFIDTMNISEGATHSTIELGIENKLIDLERPRIHKYTSAHQKSVYPNDKGMDFVASLQDQKLPWGDGL